MKEDGLNLLLLCRYIKVDFSYTIDKCSITKSKYDFYQSDR